jgi:hypothetical protein
MAVSTYDDIKTLVANVYELALLKAQEGNVIAQLVTVFNDNQGIAPRVYGEYSGGTFASIAGTADMSAQTFSASAGGTIIPATYGQQITLNMNRIKSDPAGAQRDAGQYLGETAAAHIDTNLAGRFSSLTGGTIGSGGGTLTWANIFNAQAIMRSNKIYGRYAVVLHPMHWYHLTSASSGVPTLMQSEEIKNRFMSGFYQASLDNMDFFVDANIAAGTAAVAAMFSRPAIALDIRQPFTINPQWDASMAGVGAWELNASMVYGFGVYRPTYGVQLKGTTS